MPAPALLGMRLSTRNTFHLEHSIAAAWIRQKLTAAGYDAEYQRLENPTTTQNIIAVKPGETLPQEAVLIGAPLRLDV